MVQKRTEIGRIMVWWPMAMALMGAVAFGAQADSHVTQHETRLTVLEATTAANAERLARVEQMAADIQATTHRLETKIDRR